MVTRPSRALSIAGALLLSTACAGPPRATPPPAGGPGDATVAIRVVSHGWHTGIVIARDDIPAGSWPEHRLFPPAPFLEVGWGDRAFYREADAGVSLGLAAAFASEGVVLHVVGRDRPPGRAGDRVEVVVIAMPARGLEALARFVSTAYARDAQGQVIDLGPGLAPVSRFYAATGRYSLLHNCNNWVAEALHAAGCPIDPDSAVTAGSLLGQARSCSWSPAPGRRAVE